jgi:hypothetical protein
VNYHSCLNKIAALVRVIVPAPGNDEAGAEQTAIEFVQSVFLPLRQYLPS